MKNTYVKPGFSLAPIALAADISGSCSADVKEFEDIWGENWWKADGAFGSQENCVTPFAQFCKFTSADISGNKPVFGS